MIPITLVSSGKSQVMGLNADLIIDCRGIRNPYRDPVLGSKSGNDPIVQEWVRTNNSAYVEAALDQILSAIETAPTRSGGRGKDHLTVAFFCLAGQHRSPAMKHILKQRLTEMGFEADVK